MSSTSTQITQLPSSITPQSRRPPSHNDDFWSTKINLIDQCAMCLGQVSGSRRSGVLKMKNIWWYLREDWNDFPISECAFIVGRKKDESGVYLESKVPTMCALCRDSVRTLDKLHQELTDIRKKIDTQVIGIQKMMTSVDFEEECACLATGMERERLPLRCVENNVKFLEILHGKRSEALANFLQQKRNEPAFDSIAHQISSIAVTHFFQKEAQMEKSLPRSTETDILEQQDLSEFLEVKTDISSPAPANNQIDGQLIINPLSNAPVVKTEPDSDYYDEGGQCTPPPTSINVDETDNVNDEVQTRDSSQSPKASHLNRSTRKRPRRNASRGPAKKKYFEKSDDSGSDEFIPETEDESSSEGEDSENENSNSSKSLPIKPSQRTSSENMTEEQTPAPIKSASGSATKKKMPKRVTRSKSRGSRRKPRSENEISISDKDSNPDLNETHAEHDLSSDTEGDYFDSRPKKNKRRSRSTARSSNAKSKSFKVPKKCGRPRIHPLKEGKAHVRNTLCEICCLKLSDKSLLFEHLQTHVKDFACKCETCGTAYYSRKRMQSKHYKKAVRCRTAAGHPLPPKETPKKCDTCNFETDSYITLKAHLQEHEIPTETNYSCPLPDCMESFTFRQTLEFHLDKHLFQASASAASQKCPICSEGIEYAEMDMKTHLLTVHNILETIPCNYCPHVFHNMESLVEHYMTHLPLGIRCNLCDDKIQYYKGDHMREHYFSVHQIGTQLVCDLCDYKTFTKSNLKGHQATKHLGKYRKTFSCKICTNPPVECRSKDNLMTHNIKVHGASPYKCKMCIETFDNKLAWSKHEKNHFGIAPRRQQCPHCEKTFNILGRLQYHIDRVHAQTPMERTFKCDQCDKSYYDNHALKRHVAAIHLGIKYMCEECGRNFNEPGPLKNHMRRHTGERPYKCSYCPNDFRYRDAHRRHEESHVKLGDKFQPGRTFDRKRKPL